MFSVKYIEKRLEKLSVYVYIYYIFCLQKKKKNNNSTNNNLLLLCQCFFKC